MICPPGLGQIFACSPVSPLPKKTIREEDYKLSVEDVRFRLHEGGISKSKDSIQRYCREGQLDWAKLGILKRYYVTEESVLNLINDFAKDATANSGIQVRGDAKAGENPGIQVHEAAPTKEVQQTKELHEAANSGMQENMHEHAGEEKKSVVESLLVKELRNQISDLKETNKFLQEELADRMI